MNSVVCDLFKDTSKRSDCLMSNMRLMSDELKGEKFRLATNQKVPSSIPDGVLGSFH
jgi:hypothetical protein